MGWFDKLKDWAEDKLDDVEDELGDAGNWLKDKAEDIAGDNPWANKIIDKIDDYVPERRGDRRQGHGRGDGDYVGGEIKGTWAEDAVNTVKDADRRRCRERHDGGNGDGDGGGWFSQVRNLVGDRLEGTWAEDAVNKVQDVLGGGDDAAVDTAAAGSRPLGPEAADDDGRRPRRDVGSPRRSPRLPRPPPATSSGTGIVPPAMEAVSSRRRRWTLRPGRPGDGGRPDARAGDGRSGDRGRLDARAGAASSRSPPTSPLPSRRSSRPRWPPPTRSRRPSTTCSRTSR